MEDLRAGEVVMSSSPAHPPAPPISKHSHLRGRQGDTCCEGEGLRLESEPDGLSTSLLGQVLMLRHCLTWLRATWLAQVLPLDHNIQFHQLMGYVVVGLSLVHTVAHVVNFGE